MDTTPSTQMELTPRQKLCLAHIRRLTSLKGYSPSIRELCQAMGNIGTNAVFGHLMALEEKGFIKRPPGTARAIILCDRKVLASA
jgi:repressor LexA